jgi:hypothetical protein
LSPAIRIEEAQTNQTKEERAMTPSMTVDAKPDEFTVGGESPPKPTIPPQLAEELAEIIADALAADYCGEGSTTGARAGSAANGHGRPLNSTRIGGV